MPRQWPAEASDACTLLALLSPGTEVQPCAAAVDADGCLEWLALPVGPRSAWLHSDDAVAEAEAEVQTAPSLETLQAHRDLLRAPQHFLAWLPLYDSEDTPLLERLDQ